MQNNLTFSSLTQDVFLLLIKIMSHFLLCNKPHDLHNSKHVLSIALIMTTAMPNRCYSPFYPEKSEKLQKLHKAIKVNIDEVQIKTGFSHSFFNCLNCIHPFRYILQFEDFWSLCTDTYLLLLKKRGNSSMVFSLLMLTMLAMLMSFNLQPQEATNLLTASINVF